VIIIIIIIIIIICYYFCARNLQIHTWNKPFFHGIYCCTYPLIAIYGTCNVSSHI